KPESLKIALKHSGNILSKESIILRFFSDGKRKLVNQQELHDKKVSSRENTSSK
ncbi:759_t:CDS:1, partial [Cetraspora pellucida]